MAKKNKTNIFQRFAEGFQKGQNASLYDAGKMLDKVINPKKKTEKKKTKENQDSKNKKPNIFSLFYQGFQSAQAGLSSALIKAGKMLDRSNKKNKRRSKATPIIYENEPGKVTEEFEFAVPEESPLEEAIRDLSEEGYAYVLNPEASYDTAEESFKQTMQAAYGQFGSEIFNQLYHTDMEMYGFDNKVIDAAIVETYEKYAGKECPPFADILAEIEDVIWNATTTIAKTSHLTR